VAEARTPYGSRTVAESTERFAVLDSYSDTGVIGWVEGRRLLG
jgi:hypothetical protein